MPYGTYSAICVTSAASFVGGAQVCGPPPYVAERSTSVHHYCLRGRVWPSWSEEVNPGIQLRKLTRIPSQPYGRPWLYALLGAQQRIDHRPHEFQRSGEEGQAGCPPPEVSLYASGMEWSNSQTQAH